MADVSSFVEDGPNRRISRRRSCNKNSGGHVRNKVSEKEKENNCVPVKVSPEKKSDWFCDSFNSNTKTVGKRKTSPNRFEQSAPLSSTPKTWKKVKATDEACKEDVLDTSDVMLATLDLEHVQKQNKHNKPKSDSTSKKAQYAKTQTCTNESSVGLASGKGNKSLNTTTITQSPYFASKFRNYKPTQERHRNNPASDSESQTTSECGNSVTVTDVTNNSMFSFSLVGNDTVCDDDDSIVLGSPLKPPATRYVQRVYTCNVLNTTRSLETEEDKDKLEWCPSEFATSTQVTGNIKKAGGKECMPGDIEYDQPDTQLEVHDITQSIGGSGADITQLKDKSVPVRYRCTPYKQQTAYDGCLTQYDTQTGTTQCSVLEITSIISQDNHEQNNHGDHGMDNHENHGQDDHRYHGHRQPGLISNTQSIYTGGPSQTGDIASTPICDMTGLIVDTQTQAKTGLEDSRCDVFDDSFQDPALMSQIEEINENYSQKSQGSQVGKGVRGSELHNGDLSSHTQSLVREMKNVRKKRSLDDDIDEIFVASQKRRNLGGKKPSSASDSSRSSTVNINPLERHLNTIERPEDKTAVNSVYDHVGSKAPVIIPDKKSTVLHDNVNSTIDRGNKSGLVSESAIEYNSKGKGDNSSELVNNVVTNQPVGSLQEKIRQRLKYNAGQRTPKGPNTLVDQLREQVLERAQLEAELVKESARNDVGPFYGLPSKVKGLFAQHRGITSLYEWQNECLKLPAVLNRKNLVYSLPTSGGKTLVAEILILQELLCQKRDALLILPFVSIVQEKVRNLSQFAVDLNFHVEEYAGSKGRFPPTKRRQSRSLFIATIEKAHSIINCLIEEDRMDSLGLVVVDELHMIGEGGSRGATMESTLIKLLHSAGPTQIIGMSATLSNIDDLQKFLKAEIYSNDFRPVQLTENIKVSDNIYRIDAAAKCMEDRFIHERVLCFEYKPEMERTDPNHLLGLAMEVIPDHSCLIFCPTKKNCENVALMLCKMLVKMKSDISSVRRNERKLLLKELYNDSDGRLCPVLQYTLHFGVAYHHSGLTMDERKLIEEAYSGGVLSLLTCTSTLAAGVNLPAKRVILKSPYVGKNFISRSQYKQMVGRAGRAGIDTTGESILICQQSDREKVCELLDRPIEKCHSSLCYNGGKGIRNVLLSAIGLKIVTKTKDAFILFERSLLNLQQTMLDVDVGHLVRESLQKLIDLGLVKQICTQSEDPECVDVVHSLDVTELGKATFKGPVDPDYACMLYEDLKKDECLVISTHLHLLYLVTPYDLVEDMNPSWTIYHNQMSTLTAAEIKVASIIGVPESYITMKASQQRSRKKVNEFVVKRFYLTLMLYELWCQKTVWEVAEKFQLHRGYIQSLLNSAASFASCVSHFCQEMSEFWAYQDLMGNFVKRLSYCVTAELIPLVEIPGVKLGRARLMYNAGYRTLSSVATCDVEQLVKNIQYMPRKVAKQIIASAKLLLNEKAEAIIEEVEDLVAIPASITKDKQSVNVPTPMPVTPGHSQNSLESQGT